MFLFDWIPVLEVLVRSLLSLSPPAFAFAFALPLPLPPSLPTKPPQVEEEVRWNSLSQHAREQNSGMSECVAPPHITQTTPRYNSDQQYSYIVAQQCGTRVPETDLLHVSGMQYLRALFPMDE